MCGWRRRRSATTVTNSGGISAASSSTPTPPSTRSPRSGCSIKCNIPAAILPHGDQRKLELAILLASDAELLLLDEPTAGMATEQVPHADRNHPKHPRRPTNKTIMLVEHNMNVVMNISDRITVMHLGEVLAEGTPAEITQNETVQKAYLGELYGDFADLIQEDQPMRQRAQHSGSPQHSHLHRGVSHPRRRDGRSPARQHYRAAGAQRRGQNNHAAQHIWA